MFPISITWKEDVRKAEMLTKRGFNAIWKRALQDAALFWNDNFAKKHFQRPAHSWYPEYASIRQKRKGQPLVKTGKLRDENIVKPRGLDQIAGTSRGVVVKMPLGRPPQYRGKDLSEQIRVIIAQQRLSYKAARAQTYSRATYSKKSQQTFQRLITAINSSEAARMKRVVVDSVARQANEGKGTRTKEWIRANG